MRLNPNEMTFLEHLEELRWRILKSLAAIIFFAMLAFIKAQWIINFLTAPALNLEEPVVLQALKVHDTFMVQLMASLMVGILLASPVVIYQIWRFVQPALGRASRRVTLSVVFFASFFLVAGVAFGYLILLPFSLRFFSSLGAGMVEANYGIRQYLSYVVMMMLAAGAVFQLPVLSFILTRIGLLTPGFLRKYWKFALIIILVLAAVLTPADPLSMVFMAIPLLILYEVSIIVAKVFAPKKDTDDTTEEISTPDEAPPEETEEPPTSQEASPGMAEESPAPEEAPPEATDESSTPKKSPPEKPEES